MACPKTGIGRRSDCRGYFRTEEEPPIYAFMTRDIPGALYQQSGQFVVLLHAIQKDTGAVPRTDIELAKRRMTDFKRRMDAERRQPPRAAGRDAPLKRRSGG
jgi:hypothetical protein